MNSDADKLITAARFLALYLGSAPFSNAKMLGAMSPVTDDVQTNLYVSPAEPVDKTKYCVPSSSIELSITVNSAFEE